MQKLKLLKRGLRWSPKPMKEYLAAWNLGPGVAHLHALFATRPDVWNLFWISAVNCEQPAHYFNAEQVAFVAKGAQLTSGAVVGGQIVGDLALALMPADFAAYLDAHADETSRLTLAVTLAPHWLWVIKDRSELFYEARRSDQGLEVSLPISQGETIADESSNIVTLFNFKSRPAP